MKKRVLFVIAQNVFRDEELLEPKKILEKRGVEIKIASKTRARAVGKMGTEINPDLAIAETKANDFDAVIFVGGSGAVSYFNDDEALQLARDFRIKKKMTAAICIAVSILANAGILIGKRVTGFPSEEDNLKNKGAEYTGMQVEIDGLVATAKDPSAAREFGEKIAYFLEA